MGFLDFFRPLKSAKQQRWRELGAYTAVFAPFGADLWNSDLVRSCIRPLSEHTSKANAVSSRPDIAKILNTSPNMYMNGKAFLSKIRLWLEIKNNVFIYVHRDDMGKPKGFYPVPYQTFEALDYNGMLFIKFTFNGPDRALVLPWDDLVVLRRDYYTSDIWGDDNNALLGKLDLIYTADQGTANAIKSTANLRGILKSTKAMLSRDDIKKQKDEFITDYLNLSNSGGIASLDATQDFMPITMSPKIADTETTKALREDVYRYYGVNDKIMMSDFDEETMNAFYESRIEPFLIDLSEEMTKKVFTQRERDLGAFITYESNRVQYMSNKSKLNMVQLVDRALMTPNEYRALFNMAPYEGGDEFVMRLDTSKTGDINTETEENDE